MKNKKNSGLRRVFGDTVLVLFTAHAPISTHQGLLRKSAQCLVGFHYQNMPMQHTAIFQSCKNGKFQLIFFDNFHIFAQNIGSNEYPQ